ncbi:MAG: UDP-N-acetylglucosamine 2-epimerase (hydrolyzing) [Candidatus Magasanikbacteria bacterium]|nr:UDP-N-acetylglucosamine 2-epimerase (hydrolyzing) [Candidatus Magasanikbacteria bacterium]
MKKNKKIVLVITGTRAEYGLLKSSIAELRKSSILKMRLLVTGIHTLSAHGKTINEIRRDKLPIDVVVPISQSDTMSRALAKEISGIEKYCLVNQPDIILVLGDRDEPLAATIVAGHLGITIAHIHGGDVTGGVVDDAIRNAITKFAHLHFAVSKLSATNIKNIGEESWRIHTVGAPGIDDLAMMEYFDRQELATRLKLDLAQKWFLILQHPVPLDVVPVEKQIAPTLRVVGQMRGEKIAIFPNSDTGSKIIIDQLRSRQHQAGWHVFPNVPRKVYLSLLKYADVLIGNSSSGIIESTFFHRPVINIGQRQKGREHGKNVIHVGYSEEAIKKALTLALTPVFRKKARLATHPYGRGQAGKHIVRILEKELFNPHLQPKKYVA